MTKLEVTKDFQQFVDGLYIDNYNETYDLYQVASGNEEGQTTYSLEKCKASQDMLVIHSPSNNALRLTPKALEYFPQWIEQNLMNGLDPETYWAMEHAKEKEEWEEKKLKRNNE